MNSSGTILIAVVVGAVLSKRLSYPQLRSALLGVGIVSLVAMAWLAYRIAKRAPVLDSTGIESPYQRPYRLHLRVTNAGLNHPDNPLPFRELRVEQTATHRSMQVISAAPNPQLCQGQLEALDGVELASALRDVAAMAVRSQRRCTYDTTGAALYHLNWNLAGFGEALAEGEVAMTAGCLAADASPQTLVHLLHQIYLRLFREMECTPHHLPELNVKSELAVGETYCILPLGTLYLAS